MTTTLPIHPVTGLRAIGFTRRGPVWPVLGGAETDVDTMTLDQCRTAARELLDGTEGDLVGADAERFQQLTQRVEGLRERDRQRTNDRQDMMRRFAAGDLALEGPDGMRRADGSALPGYEPPADADRPQSIRQRDGALRVLDRSVKDELVTASGAETVERQLGSPTARPWVSRWVQATGSDHYRNAFAKKCLDPDNGHLSWTREEGEAWRTATAVAHERAASLTDSQGGFLVPFQLDTSVLLTSGGSTNPLLEIARVEPTVGDVWHGVTSAGVSAEWLAEAGEAADASPTFGQPSIPCHKAMAFTPFSFEVGMDAPGFLTELQRLLLDGLDQLTSAAFTVGTGTGQPTGVVTAVVAAGGSSLVAPNTVETYAAADVFKVQNAAAPRFNPNASWLGNLGWINTTRQFETGNGALKFPELAANPPMLLGRRVYENSHMDSVINPSATESNYIALYGDFKQFCITLRLGSTFELIQNLIGANRRPTGQRGGVMYSRWGSDVLVPNAFRLLSIPTTA